MDPFIGMLALTPYNFAPRGWAFCDGQILSIASNTALFSLLGTTYGGNGQTTFGLPDLRGRSPIGVGTGPGLPSYQLGQAGGSATVALNVNQMPAHTHSARTLTVTETTDVAGTKDAPVVKVPTLAESPAAISVSGAGQAHENMPPFLAMHWIIALEGIYPSRAD